MPKILISDSMNQIATEIFEKNNIEVDVNTDLSLEDLQKIIVNYDGLVVRSATKVTKEIINTKNILKIIGRAGAGVDNIDLNSAKDKDIIVMNTPGANTNSTAEHAFALILSLYRNIPLANESTHQGLWEKKKFKGLELRNKKIGLIGFGNVAKRVAEIAKNLGMEVLVYSNYFTTIKDQFPDIKQISFNDIISFSDIISFHCKSQSSPLINLKELQLMKKNAVIINTARGNLINEKDLKDALDNSFIKGAAIDVFSNEPAKHNVLFGTRNLILTPHIAASTEEAQIMVAKQIAEQISDYFISGKITNQVS